MMMDNKRYDERDADEEIFPPRKVLLSEARLRVLVAELETARNIGSKLQTSDEP